METKQLPKFEATIGWLKEAMRLRELDSSFIKDDDCWAELGGKKDLVSKEFLVEARQALIASGPKNGWACYDYLFNIDKEDGEVRQALIDSGDGGACYHYLIDINKDDKEARQALIDSGDGTACYRYILYIDKEDKEVMQVVLAEGYLLPGL